MSYKPSSYWDRLEVKNEREALARQCEVMREVHVRIAAVTKAFNDYCASIDAHKKPLQDVSHRGMCLAGQGSQLAANKNATGS